MKKKYIDIGTITFNCYTFILILRLGVILFFFFVICFGGPLCNKAALFCIFAPMESYQCPVAVLLLVFNRPQHGAAALLRIRLVQPARLYIHADGARSGRPGEAEAVVQTRRIVDLIDWPCEVITLFREENKGLREGVGDALNWFFREEPCGIVIEDDCLPDPSFFRFCAELLERYAHDETVMHIGGSNLIERFTKDGGSDYFWSEFSLVWGWASWRRAWANMDIRLTGLDAFKTSDKMQDFISSIPARAYMLDKFEVTRARKNNSWAYAWFYSILNHGGICIVPSVNLIQNVGIGDTNATNTTGFNAQSAIAAGAVQFPLRHPEHQKVDPMKEKQLFFHTQKSRFRLWLWYVLHLMGLR